MATSSPVCNIQLKHDINEIVSCVENGTLRGIPADSASPTDVYIFKFRPNTFYGIEPVQHGFMKIFVSNPVKFYRDFEEEIEALNYEIKVYERTKKLIDNNVIGHFVKYFTSLNQPTKFSNLNNFISEKANISIGDARKNLKRNTIFMIKNQGINQRPSITDNTRVVTQPNVFSLSEQHDVRYKFILTEAVVPYVPYYNPISSTLITQIQDFRNTMSVNSSIKLSYINDFLGKIRCYTNINECKFLLNTLLEIYFQLAVTTYAMYLNGFVHNDLHDGNIWIKRINSTNIKYTLRDVSESPFYTLKSCNNFSMLYDYDRSYIINKDNPLLASSIYLEEYNQTNELIQQRDFVKILCYLLKNLLPKLSSGGTTIKKNKLESVENEKIKLYNDLLNCICKDNETGFTTKPVGWVANTTKWPNEIDRFRDFWDRIFNNLEILEIGGVKETNNNYECFLKRAGGIIINNLVTRTSTTTSIELNHLEPVLYNETLYTMPEIIDNLAKVVNKYNSNKIQKNEDEERGIVQRFLDNIIYPYLPFVNNIYYNYDIRRIP